MVVDAAAITTNLVVIVVTANAAMMVAAANTIQIKVRKNVRYDKICTINTEKIDTKNKIGQDVK